MKRTLSLRTRITLICAALLTLCCILLTISNNLSAVRMVEQIDVVPVFPAQGTAWETPADQPDGEPAMQAAPALQQAQKVFHVRSLLSMAVILGAGLLLINYLVGRALAPLRLLSDQIHDRTVQNLAQPLPVPNGGDEVTALARSFNEMSQRLDRAFVMQRSFSQNAAHEFRTPLAILKMRIGLFRKKQAFSPGETESFLEILEGEVDRLSDMVDSLLNLTNLDRVPRGDQIELQALLDQARAEVLPLAAQKGTEILTESVPGVVGGSRELLHRALFNLLENAVKYGPEGGLVQAFARLDGAQAVITVEDRNAEIPAELRERIFEPFFRVDTARSRDLGGSGLGLALVRAIAEVHGGSVGVEESRRGGNRWVFRFPANPS